MPDARLPSFIFTFFIFSVACFAQSFAETHPRIRTALEKGDYAGAAAELQNLERADKNVFTLNNYDYLLARLNERRGEQALAAAGYEAVVRRNSVLSEYALWRLAQIARASGNLMLERIYLRQLLTAAPASLLKNAAAARLLRSNFESGDYEAVVQTLTAGGGDAAVGGRPSSAPQTTDRPPAGAAPAGGVAQAGELSRENLVFLGESYLRLARTNEAREIFTRLVANLPNPAQPDDFALAAARGLDELDGGRENFGKTAPQLADAEHYRRASIYQFNRDFARARLHYRALVERYPQYIFAPEAMYQIGRGYAQENNYDEAINWFERVQAEYPANPISRDALSQAASAYARVNKPREAAARYQKYIEKYPDAENLDRAYLNIVDVKRDSGEETEALKWTQKTRETFRGKLPEAVALFAQARIRISQNDWAGALADVSELQKFADLGGTRVPGGTNQAEVTFLKGFALENLGRFQEAVDVYLSIPDGRNEYYGWRATERLRALAEAEKSKPAVEAKLGSFLKTISEAGATSLGTIFHFGVMQSAFRLTNNPDLRATLLRNIQGSYELLASQSISLQPNYRAPAFKLLEFGRREVLREKKPFQTGYHQTLADELLFLGLYDEGTPELEAALREKLTKNTNSLADFPADTAFTLAVFYNRGEMANRAVAFIEPHWRAVAADYQVELIPREQAALLYPAPYAEALLKYAPERGVDPRFALSIMRQESRYRADVKSNAAARGLMQFISTTSDRLAAEMGLKSFRQDDLYHPPTAILFGSQYLGNLFRQFPAQPPAVAGAYNGGENNIERWMARSKTNDPDRYVPEIIFSQSKDYVYRVMANYRVYRHFYDENLKMK